MEMRPMRDRIILHCDLNGFFASVEELNHPEVGGRPMAVCGDPELRHGIVLAKNEAAKKFGVSTGETIWSARRKCPDLILLPSHHDEYRKYSVLANGVYCSFTPRVERFGIDESWLDVSHAAKDFREGGLLADKIRETVKKKLGLTLSVGVSFNKVFAKLGSDFKKPDATTVFGRDSVENVIWKLPVSNLLYVGKNTCLKLSRMGVRTIGDLAKCSKGRLERAFGKFGACLHDSANGLDDSPVNFWGEEEEAKSVGNSITFRRDLKGAEEIKIGLGLVADKVSERLVLRNLKAGMIRVVLKDPEFRTLSRQEILPIPTNLRKDLISESFKLVEKFWNLESPVRLLGISAGELTGAESEFQAELFPEKSREKLEAAERTMQTVRRKFGRDSIQFGNSIGSGL